MGNTILFLLVLCCCSSIPLAFVDIDMMGCRKGSPWQITEGRSVRSHIHVHSPVYEQAELRCTITRRQNLPPLEVECESKESFRRGTCNSSDAESVQADWDGHHSVLTISRVDRSLLNLSCNATATEGNDTYTAHDSCQLDVVYSAEVDSCQFHVNKQLWSVVGFCDVTKVFSSAEVYYCRVYQRSGSPSWYSTRTEVQVNHTTQLTSYINSTSGLMYYGGKFPFTVPLASPPGNYTIKVWVYPGYTHTVMTPTVYVAPPDDPILTNCDQVVIIEGGNSTVTPCVCTVASLGSPTGRLRWLSVDKVLVSGVYGVKELPFPYEKMDRTRSEQAMSCQVDWIDSKNSSSFTPEFIYGPDTATIFVAGNDGDNPKVLMCTSLDVQPLSALVVTWGGLCEGQTGRVCSLTLPVSEPGETEVTCSVTNRRLPQNRATAKWNLNADGQTTPQTTLAATSRPSEEKLSFYKGVGLGVGGTLFIVLVMVAVLLVVLWKRGHLPACQCCIPIYDKPSKRKQRNEEEEHTYTDMNVYECPGTSSDRGRPETRSDRGRPGTSSDRGRPETRSDRGRPGTSSDRGRPETRSDRGRPGTSSDRGRPETRSDRGRPGTSSGRGRPGTSSDRGRSGQKAASNTDAIYVNEAADL